MLDSLVFSFGVLTNLNEFDGSYLIALFMFFLFSA